MGLFKATKTCFQKYFVLSGRASRSEFWWFFVFQIIFGIALVIADVIFIGVETLDNEGSIYTQAASLLLFCPTLTVSFRRLHDTGKSGWYLLTPLAGTILGFSFGAIAGDFLGQTASIIAGLIIILGVLLQLWWFVKPSDPNENKYGPPPNDTTLSPNPNEVTP